MFVSATASNVPSASGTDLDSDTDIDIEDLRERVYAAAGKPWDGTIEALHADIKATITMLEKDTADGVMTLQPVWGREGESLVKAGEIIEYSKLINAATELRSSEIVSSCKTNLREAEDPDPQAWADQYTSVGYYQQQLKLDAARASKPNEPTLEQMTQWDQVAMILALRAMKLMLDEKKRGQSFTQVLRKPSRTETGNSSGYWGVALKRPEADPTLGTSKLTEGSLVQDPEEM